MKEFGGKSEVNDVSSSQQMERPQMSPELQEKYEKLTGLDKIPKTENRDKEMSAPEGERPIDVAKKDELPKEGSALPNKYEELSGMSELKAYLDNSSENNKETENRETDKVNEQKDADDGQPIKNKLDGLAREKEVEEELKDKYPEDEGYEILSEVYLRDKDGNIVRDPETGEARRIDFVVVKDGKVVDSVEVTSKTADKTEQSSKEARIRESGGNYVRDNNGNLVEIPADVTTRIERRD